MRAAAPIVRPIVAELAPRAGRLLVSIVVPVRNEQASIQPFLLRIRVTLREPEPVVAADGLFVNDGGRDGTEFVIRSARLSDPDIRLVDLSRNFGTEAALRAGIAHARGDAVVPIDVGLQDPPRAIPAMVATWRAGARIVDARRADRFRDSWLKRSTARGFYCVVDWLADQPIPRGVGDVRPLDRQMVDALCTLGKRVRFNKALFPLAGFEHLLIEVAYFLFAGGTLAFRLWVLRRLAAAWPRDLGGSVTASP